MFGGGKCTCNGCGREWCGVRFASAEWRAPDWICGFECNTNMVICKFCTCPQCGVRGIPCNYPNCSEDDLQADDHPFFFAGWGGWGEGFDMIATAHLVRVSSIFAARPSWLVIPRTVARRSSLVASIAPFTVARRSWLVASGSVHCRSSLVSLG